VVAKIAFPDSGGWDTWKDASARVRLAKGQRTVRLETIGHEGPNVDYLLLRRVK
jgi:hypothetical protein